MKHIAINLRKLSRNVKSGFIIFLFCFSLFGSAQVTLIPDTEFEQALIDNGYDSDGVINGQVLTNDISSRTSLTINGYNISNFEGLQDFTSLATFLHLNNNTALSFDIDFSGNLQLTVIDIVITPNLSQVDVSQNIQLTHLQVLTQGTLFNSIDVSNNINLVDLIIVDNAITNIDTANNTLLTYLNVNSNPIISLEVSHLNLLETLAISNNQIEVLNLSYNNNLSTLLADGGTLQYVNLKNGANLFLTYMDLRNNPNLSCIVVDYTIDANNAIDWFKDTSAMYVDNSLTMGLGAQDQIVQHNGDDQQFEIDSWLANNGGATATIDCGEITWSYNYYVSDGNGNIIYYFDFFATDVFGNSVTTSATFTLENAGPFNEEVYGSGTTICDDIFDLNTVITDIDPTADLNDPNIDVSLSRISSGEFNEGPLGESFSGTIVDFPDTGAGSYSYLFRVNVESFLTIYKPDTGDFMTIGVHDEANITINDKTVAFEIQPLSDLEICEGVFSSIQDLTDMLIISPDPSVLPPQDAIDLNQYWTPSVYTGSGTYTFDPTAAFPNCPSNAVSITITETQEFFAGDDVLDAQDDSFYSCGDTVSFNLNSFLDVSADSGGEWRDSNNILISNGIVDFPDTGAGQFTKSFSYRQENNDCGFFSEANYDITYDAAELSVGTSSSITVCEGTSVTEQELINELGADDGGFWDVSIDIDNVGAGTFIYSHGDCSSSSGDTTITVIEEQQLFAGDDTTLAVCGENLEEADMFSVLGVIEEADKVGQWTENGNPVSFPVGEGTFVYTHLATSICPEVSATVMVTLDAYTPKVFLQGAMLNPNIGEENLMRDDLRVLGYIPTISPYGDGTSCDASVFNITGNDAIVDWVFIELRSEGNNTNIVASQSALLQRDGDIVDVDGISSLCLDNLLPGNYYVAVKHRNHLGVMSANAIGIGSNFTKTVVDFTSNSASAQGGTNALIDLGAGIFAIYAGDYDTNAQVQNTDATSVIALLGESGYSGADMDVNSQIQNTDINILINPNMGLGQQYSRNITNTSGVTLMPLANNNHNINFTFANAQNTNDGVNDFYEVDVLIESDVDFKLGSGQLYFNYNTAAFGMNISANTKIEYSQPLSSVLGEKNVLPIYGSFIQNDNTSSRFSLSWQQALSSGTILTDNVTAVPAMLFRIKIKYTNVNEDPMFTFETDALFLDQTFTAFESTDLASVNYPSSPREQLLNDTFDSSGATLLDKDFELLQGFSLYPNPTNGMLYIKGDVNKLKSVEVYSITGQKVMEVNKEKFREIDISPLKSAFYFVILNTEIATKVIKVIKE